MLDYSKILVFSVIACGLCVILASIPVLIAKYSPSSEKSSEYECGISPIGDVKHPFDVQFYIVAILFIIFDLEVILLFPWVLHLKTYSVAGFYSAIALIFVLTVGLVYEFKSRALDW